MARKHCGKRGNCSMQYEQFLLFPECFQKTCTADTLKQCLFWKGERVKLSPHDLDFNRPQQKSFVKLGKIENTGKPTMFSTYSGTVLV